MMHQASPPIITDVSPSKFDTNFPISPSLCAFLFTQVADDDNDDEKLITVGKTAMSPPITMHTHVTSASAKKEHNIQLATLSGWSTVTGQQFLTFHIESANNG